MPQTSIIRYDHKNHDDTLAVLELSYKELFNFLHTIISRKCSEGTYAARKKFELERFRFQKTQDEGSKNLNNGCKG